MIRVGVQLFKGGQIANHFLEWKNFTSDPKILSIVAGDVIDFDCVPPIKHSSYAIPFSKAEKEWTTIEIKKMLSKGVIAVSRHEKIEYISPIFLTPKQDGGHRLILNLKDLNEYISYEHFKMDGIAEVLHLVTKNCFMCKVDLKDAYYSVRIHPKYQSYLKFCWDDTLYQYTCYPNGLAPCPRKFTKLMKVPLSVLRSKGHKTSGYIDDFFTCARTFGGCKQSLMEMIELFIQLGFVIHPTKTVLRPTQKLEFLGFLIDSSQMTVSLTEQKKCTFKKMVNKLLTIKRPTLRFIAKVIGTIVAAFPASRYGPLFYRSLDKDKTQGLQWNQGDFDATHRLSEDSLDELSWWRENICTMYSPILPPKIQGTMYCDASDIAWGVHFTSNTGGGWTESEAALHINARELLAIFYSLKTFRADLRGTHVKVFSDNTTAVAVVNHMGTSKSDTCNQIGKKIWLFCQAEDIWVTCAHVPGVENEIADFESRRDYKDSEWMLHPQIFREACDFTNFEPNLDCFANRINTQLKDYVSFRPDPSALFIDAFTVDWAFYKPYLFPPFSIVGKTLQKIMVDQAEVLMVVPRWPSKPWFNLFQDMLVGQPLVVAPDPQNLVLPARPSEVHPLAEQVTLLVGRLSGRHT